MKTMKPKKPALIKGKTETSGFVLPWDGCDASTYLCLPIDNPDALVEQVAAAMIEAKHSDVTFGDYARAALRSIGVPLKGRK